MVEIELEDHLLALFDSEPDPGLVGEPFDAWCEENMLPWVADHVAMDEDAVRRWEGGDVDLMRKKVAAESGSKQVDLWIRSAGEPESNPEYDPIA